MTVTSPHASGPNESRISGRPESARSHISSARATPQGQYGKSPNQAKRRRKGAYEAKRLLINGSPPRPKPS